MITQDDIMQAHQRVSNLEMVLAVLRASPARPARTAALAYIDAEVEAARRNADRLSELRGLAAARVHAATGRTT